MHRPPLFSATERAQPALLHCVGRNDTESSAGAGTPRDAARSARVRAEPRLTGADGIAVSEKGKALDQTRNGDATMVARGVGQASSEKESSMVEQRIAANK